MTKAYSYIRMSTLEQLKGDSARRQQKETQEYVAANGLELVDIYHDRGVSAFTGKNAEFGELKRFLEAAESGEIDQGSYLIVESLDRISRSNLMAAMAVLEQIVRCGVNIVTLIDRQIYSQETIAQNPYLMMGAVMTLLRAHEESLTKSVRLKAAWANKRDIARSGTVTRQRIPGWLRYDEHGALEPIPERAAILHEIFTLSTQGHGAYSITKLLNDRAEPTWGRAKFWQESYVKKLLSNRAVLGELQPHRLSRTSSKRERSPDGEPVVGYYPVVIDPVTFDDAQAAAKRRETSGRGRKGSNFSNLFTGMLKCRICDGGIRFIDKGSAPKGGQYLQCSRAVVSKSCEAPAFRYGLVESLLLQVLSGINFEAILNGPEWGRMVKELRTSILADRLEIEQLAEKGKNLASAIAEGGYTEWLLAKNAEIAQEYEVIRESMRQSEIKLSELSADSRLDHIDLITRLKTEDLTAGERVNMRRLVWNELKKVVKQIKLGRTYPTPGDDIDPVYFAGLSINDFKDQNRFIEFQIIYRNNDFGSYDHFTGQIHHSQMNKNLSIFKERAIIRDIV
ncbi:MAG TPA: recombinase family protein [Sphingobium sp.]|uniref:recombinase family protein n=1 Tax=Sphingobium sp. TaxID=1912891 RepID=UPI002ED197C4